MNQQLQPTPCGVWSLDAGASDLFHSYEHKTICTAQREMQKWSGLKSDIFLVNFCTRDFLEQTQSGLCALLLFFFVLLPCSLVPHADARSDVWQPDGTQRQRRCSSDAVAIRRPQLQPFHRPTSAQTGVEHRFGRRSSCHRRSQSCALQHGALDFGTKCRYVDDMLEGNQADTTAVQVTRLPAIP